MKTLLSITQLSHRLCYLNLNDLMIRQPWYSCPEESIHYLGTWEDYHVMVHVLAPTSPNYGRRIAGIYSIIEAINTVGIELFSEDKQRIDSRRYPLYKRDSLLLKAPLGLFEIEQNGTTCMAYLSLSAVPPPGPGSGPSGQYLHEKIVEEIAGFLSMAG